MTTISTTRASESQRPGHLSTPAHIGVYVVLFTLVGVDYLLLSQSLILLNAGLSKTASIGASIYIITLGFSTMMVSLPHVAAVIVRRIGDGLMDARWRFLPILIGAIWLAILVLVTTMRIVSALTAHQSSTLSGLKGATAATAAPSFDPLAPESLMAYLTAFFLTATGLISFFVTWFTSRPRLVALERAEVGLDRAKDARDAADAEKVLADETLETAREGDQRDLERLGTTKTVVSEEIAKMRSVIATRIAENDGSPESTSQMIRELKALRLAQG